MKTKFLLFALPLIALGMNTHALEAKTYASKSYNTRFATGLVRTTQSQAFLNTAPRASFISADAAVPGSYSIRGQAGPVEDQGQCGSCWDFSLTTVLRGTHMMASKDPGRLSFNYLLNCATTMMGCNGGDFSAADYFVNPQGAPAYGTDGGDYTATDGACVHAAPVASTVAYKLLGTNLGQIPTGTPPSFKDIAYVVGVLHQPVSIDIAADLEFESYSSGVFNGCSNPPSDVNHMVVIEGYNCEASVDAQGNCTFDANGNLPPNVGTYLIRNSWGAVWGDSGYVTMKATDSQGNRCDQVAMDALYYTGN